MTQKKDLKTFVRTIIILAVLLMVFFFVTLMTGTVSVSFSDLFNSSNAVVFDIRLPRALLSMIIGGALSVSGFLLQTYFKNPIAGPFVLGISSGAKMMVAILLYFSVCYSLPISSFGMIASAFIGSMLVIFFLIIISRHIDVMAALLVSGIMTGYICNAVCDVLVTFFADNDVVNLRNWTKGSFSGADISSVKISFVIVIVCFILVMCLSKPIEAVMLSESYAFTMGVNVKRLRLFIIIVSGILSATAAAFAGPISFVGVAVPFLSAKLLKNTKPLFVIPICFVLGAFVCLICDLIARTVFAPMELNISTVTAIIGAPVVIFMIITNRRK